MTRRARVTLAESAIRDLEETRDWYRDQGVPDIGDRLIRELIAHIESLADLPERGRVVPELESPMVRELIHPPFRIVYRLDPGVIRVVRVWRGERLLRLPPG